MESKELEQKIYNILFMSNAPNATSDTKEVMQLVTAEVERATLTELENLLLTREGERYIDFDYLSERIKRLQPQPHQTI